MKTTTTITLDVGIKEQVLRKLEARGFSPLIEKLLAEWLIKSSSVEEPKK